MKRIALFILSLALAAPAFAQEGDSRDIYTNGIFAFNIADHVGWGYNIVTTDAFTPAYCGEYFINVLALKVRPVFTYRGREFLRPLQLLLPRASRDGQGQLRQVRYRRRR